MAYKKGSDRRQRVLFPDCIDEYVEADLVGRLSGDRSWHWTISLIAAANVTIISEMAKHSKLNIY